MIRSSDGRGEHHLVDLDLRHLELVRPCEVGFRLVGVERDIIWELIGVAEVAVGLIVLIAVGRDSEVVPTPEGQHVIFRMFDGLKLVLHLVVLGADS